MGIRENERIVDLGVGLGGDFGQRSRIRGKKKVLECKRSADL